MTFILASTLLIVLAVYGTFISRWHGGGFIPGAPKVLKNFLWAAPFAAVALYATGNLYVYAAALAVSMIGKGTGHGGGMDLAHSPKEPGAGRKPEKLEYLILWLHGKIPQYWYDFLLLVIIGLVSVLGAVIAVGYVDIIAGLIIALGGVLKAVAYAVGWYYFPTKHGKVEAFDEATEIGEGLTGFFAFTGLAISIILLGT